MPKQLSSLERAKLHYADRARGAARFGQVASKEKGYAYFNFDPMKLDEGQIYKQRQELIGKGFDPVKDGKGYVVGAPQCEIWRCPQETADFHFKQRQKWAYSRPGWVKNQQSRIRPAGHGFIDRNKIPQPEGERG